MQQQSSGGGMMSGLGGAMASGMASGVGFGVGSAAVNSMLGGGSSSHGAPQ